MVVAVARNANHEHRVLENSETIPESLKWICLKDAPFNVDEWEQTVVDLSKYGKWEKAAELARQLVAHGYEQWKALEAEVLVFGAKKGDLDTVMRIFNDRKDKVTEADLTMALMQAVVFERIEMCDLLIHRWGGSRNPAFALHIAAMTGNRELCETLLDSISPANQRVDDEWGSPLHVAAMHGNEALYDYLVERGMHGIPRGRADGGIDGLGALDFPPIPRTINNIAWNVQDQVPSRWIPGKTR